VPRRGSHLPHTIEDLLEQRPDVVAISAATENFGDAVEMARVAKEFCGAKTLIGGMHVTSLPHTLPKAFDAGCVGEGELTMIDLVKLYQSVENPGPADYAKVPGICFHQAKWVQVNPARELIRDLDDLPLPDRDLLGEGWKVPYSKQVHLISSRGCPYDCSFCSSSLHWKRFRYFSPEYTANEIERMRELHDPKEFYFFDDLFIANRKRFRAICEKFRERGLHNGIMFRSYARVDLVDEELAELFEEFNFVFIDFGFESNSQKVLDYFRKRNVTPEINQRAIDILAKRRVSIGANIIMGSPHENDADLDESIKFIERNRDRIDRVSMGPLFPLPGTPIWTEAKMKGLVQDDMSDWERIGFDPDNFDIERYPLLSEQMTREHLYRRYLDFRGLTREINLVGQLRKTEHENRNLRDQLARMNGSRLVKAAWGARNALQGALRTLRGEGGPAVATTRPLGPTLRSKSDKRSAAPYKRNGEANGAVPPAKGSPPSPPSGSPTRTRRWKPPRPSARPTRADPARRRRFPRSLRGGGLRAASALSEQPRRRFLCANRWRVGAPFPRTLACRRFAPRPPRALALDLRIGEGKEANSSDTQRKPR
jgi:anaerobic magnesium-protoporphyrin IX monomethyl ester cyclase